jgi:hypothetical protein
MFETQNMVFNESKMPLLNKTIFSCEIIVLSYKSNDFGITYYSIYDHFATQVVTLIGVVRRD